MIFEILKLTFKVVTDGKRVLKKLFFFYPHCLVRLPVYFPAWQSGQIKNKSVSGNRSEHFR